MERSKRTLTQFFKGGALLFSLLCLLLIPMKAEAAIARHSLSLNNTWAQNSLVNKDQVHYFTFTTPSAGYVELSFCAFESGQRWEFLDADLQKQDWGWSEVQWGASPSNPKSVTYGSWLEAGTYIIRISCYNGEDSVGDFWVKAAFRSAGNREQEPNQTYAQAQNVALGTTVRGLLSAQDENDYYSFILPRAQTINLQVICYCSGIRARIMDSNMVELTKDTIWGGSESSPEVYAKEIALTSGKYYVHIDAYGSDTQGLYDYKVTAAAVKAKSVSLNRTSVTLYEGNSTTLSATVYPADATNKIVNWSTSRSSVATVDGNGRITARRAGTAVITATSTDGSGASASCTVTVQAKPIQKTLYVDKTSVKLYKNQKLTLRAATSPSAKITFTSSNSKIAKVNKKGKITAVKKGKCKIYVRANGIQRTVNVQVKNPELKVKKSKIKLAVKKKHIIECSVKPAAKVTYQSSNKKIATVSKSGKIKAKRKGTCKIYVKAHGITKTIKLTVK